MRDVLIHRAMNGFRVKVGCAELVFTEVTVLLAELRRYIENPGVVEGEYLERFGHPGAAQGVGGMQLPPPITGVPTAGLGESAMTTGERAALESLMENLRARTGRPSGAEAETPHADRAVYDHTEAAPRDLPRP